MPKRDAFKISLTPGGDATITTVDPNAPTVQTSDQEQASALVRFLARTTGRNACELLGYLTAVLIGPTERAPGWAERHLLRKGIDDVARSFLGQTLEICQRHLVAAFDESGPIVPDPAKREDCVAFAKDFLEAASLDDLWRDDEIAWGYAGWAAILCDRPDLVTETFDPFDFGGDYEDEEEVDDADGDDTGDDESADGDAGETYAEITEEEKETACESMADQILEARLCFDFVRAATAPTLLERNATCPCGSSLKLEACCLARAKRAEVN